MDGHHGIAILRRQNAELRTQAALIRVSQTGRLGNVRTREKKLMQERFIPVLNSLVFIQDEDSREPPEINGIGAVWTTKYGLAVCCLPDSEGDTRLMLIEPGELPPGLTAVFDGMIDTPSGWITVETILDNVVFRVPAIGPTMRVRVWGKGHRASDIIVLQFGNDWVRQPACAFERTCCSRRSMWS